MDAVLRTAAMYLFLVVLFRVVGRRALAEITPFDLVLLLIIAEAVGPAMLDQDPSFTTAMLVIVTLVGLEIVSTVLQSRYKRFDRLVDGTAILLVDDGRLLRERMRAHRVDEDGIMQAAREMQGLERIEQVKYAVLERSGRITIVPRAG
jgi:uncharacterized membrane protein YcaP (DUF421 family)